MNLTKKELEIFDMLPYYLVLNEMQQDMKKPEHLRTFNASDIERFKLKIAKVKRNKRK